MIFSKLFASKAAWQDKNPSNRVIALEKDLTLDSNEDKQIIVELAKNDESDLVRRAALLKLNDTSFWQSIGLQDSNQAVKKLAAEHIVNTMLDSNEKLESKLSLLPLLPKQLCDQILEKSNDAQLVLSLVKQVEKQQQLVALFCKKQSSEIQHFIVDQIDDITTLEKLTKKTTQEDVLQTLNTKILAIQEAKEKPLKVAKAAQLILSKLLALKDNTDYRVVIEKRATLENEWSSISDDVTNLEHDKSLELQNKFEHISVTLDKVFVAKKEQYEQEQIAFKAKQQQEEARVSFKTFISAQSQAISEAIFENASIDEAKVSENLTDFSKQVSASNLPELEKASFAKDANALLERLEKVSDIAESVSIATQLISRMTQQSPPQEMSEYTEKQEQFKQWLKDWRENLQKADGVLPQSLIEAHKEIKSSWLSALAPLEKAQDKQFHFTQRKVSDLKRLLSSGKYNAAFGVFNKFKKLFDELNTDYQRRLQRDFEQLSEKMAELSDWEHYIATPRKQELLSEVTALAETPLDNPSEQAEKVKQFRKTWNSLGHADEAIDQELNKAFNDMCEKAFAPCRQFYAEQEKVREMHLEKRNAILAEAKCLANEHQGEGVDYKHVEAKLNKIQQSWRSAGEVDRKVYKKINQDFLTTVKPIKAAVEHYHDVNITEKEKLISKAESLKALDDVYSAVQQLKEIQATWKTVGYAGVKKENALWTAFRAINDEIFAKRSEVNQEKLAYVAKVTEQIQETLASLEKDLDQATNEKQIDEIANKATTLKEQANSKDAYGAIEKFIERSQRLKSTLKKAAKKSQWQRIFDLTELAMNGDSDLVDVLTNEQDQQLTPTMQRKMLDALSNESDGDRHLMTLQMEILAGIESPSEDESKRMEVQVGMMQDKMNSGELTTVEDKFWQWLSASSLSSGDLVYLQRIRPIILK
ncbi:DUF349 domain-containing protein [Thalassotalea euphylliae]|uniref:DUF349 domain-containing protein n=1 Tax=Thalassotalea euphylliae TaxID=1655234 RepID=UPI003627B2CA